MYVRMYVNRVNGTKHTDVAWGYAPSRNYFQLGRWIGRCRAIVDKSSFIGDTRQI